MRIRKMNLNRSIKLSWVNLFSMTRLYETQFYCVLTITTLRISLDVAPIRSRHRIKMLVRCY